MFDIVEFFVLLVDGGIDWCGDVIDWVVVDFGF